MKLIFKSIIVLTVTLSLFKIENVAAANFFSDIENSWAKKDIEFMKNIKLAGGYSNGTFNPNGEVTRAEAAAFLSRALVVESANENFSDVSDSHWASKIIGGLANKGIIGGYSDGTYKPENKLTREEMSALLIRAYNLTGNTTLNFTDEVSPWAKGVVETLVANGITGGYPDGTFKGKNPITRAEFVVLLKRTMEKTNKVPLVTNPLIDDLNLSAETVIIKNYGNEDLHMTGWILKSVEGNQTFNFPNGFILKKDSTVTITAGSNGINNPPNYLKGWNNEVWLNTGDKAQLINNQNEIVSEVQK